MQGSDFFVGARSGLTRAQLRWGEASGRWARVGFDVYRFGGHPVSDLDRVMGVVVATDGTASGHLAALLQRFDAGGQVVVDVTVDRTQSDKRNGLRHRLLAPERVIEVAGFRCTDGLQTLVDIAHRISDDEWEQALESVVRMGLASIGAVEDALPELGRARTPGTRRIRRVLLQRPAGAPPTGSWLETVMIQIARLVPLLPPPERQVVVLDRHGQFVAKVDLAWPALGLFIELDGEQHLGQPVYDARRETGVVAATGWLCGRFTWTECVHHRNATARRLEDLVRQAKNRPLAIAS
jgi:hypothetical protein